MSYVPTVNIYVAFAVNNDVPIGLVQQESVPKVL